MIAIDTQRLPPQRLHPRWLPAFSPSPIVDFFAPASQICEASGKLLSSGGLNSAGRTVTGVGLAFSGTDIKQKTPAAADTLETLDTIERTAAAGFLIADTGDLVLNSTTPLLSSLPAATGAALSILGSAAGVIATGVEVVKAVEYVAEKDYTLASTSACGALGSFMIAFAAGPVGIGVGAALALGSGLVSNRVKDHRDELRHDRMYSATFATLPTRRDELPVSVLVACAQELDQEPTEFLDRILELEEGQVLELIEKAHELFQVAPPSPEAIALFQAHLQKQLSTGSDSP